jgi:hypothetical protein
VSIVPPEKTVGCDPTASPEKFSLPAAQDGAAVLFPLRVAVATATGFLLDTVSVAVSVDPAVVGAY